MKFVYESLAFAIGLSGLAANAETGEPKWTLSTSGSWSEINSSDRDAVSISASLARQIGPLNIGASVATSNGSDALFDQSEVTDRSSIFGSVWIAFPIGASNLDLSVTYGEDDYDGVLDSAGSRFPSLQSSTATITSEVDNFSVAAALSRTFISGDWDIIPNTSMSWSGSKSTTIVTVSDETLQPLALNEEQKGLTGTVGLGIGYVAHDQIYIFADGVGLYTENGASNGSSSVSRFSGLRANARQDAGESIWTEVSVGASLSATDTITLSFTGGTTAGREDDEVFASTSLSVAF